MPRMQWIDSIRDGGAGGGWKEASRNNKEMKKTDENQFTCLLIHVGPCQSHNQPRTQQPTAKPIGATIGWFVVALLCAGSQQKHNNQSKQMRFAYPDFMHAACVGLLQEL